MRALPPEGTTTSRGRHTTLTEDRDPRDLSLLDLPSRQTAAALRRSLRVGTAVLLYVVMTSAWFAATAAAIGLTDVPPAAVAAVGAGSYLAVSAVGLWWTLLRSAAAAVEVVGTAREVDERAEVERLRTMFLGSVSHELRTPVTGMIGYAETIMQHHSTLPRRQLRHFAERLVANGHRLERLILDLLDLHPDSFVDTEPRPTKVDLDDLLADAVDARVDGVHVLQFRSSVGVVVLDERKVRRIVDELLDNVVRHTPAGTRVTVSAASHRETVLLVVEDDGPGLDPSVAAAAVQPFVQGRHLADAATPGLGIGLALAARYAELHGGTLELGASTSGGTRAAVTLPTLGCAEAA